MDTFYSSQANQRRLIMEAYDRLEFKDPFLLNGRSPGGFGCAGYLEYLHLTTGAFKKPFDDIPVATGRYPSDQLTIRRISKFLSRHPEIFVETEAGTLMVGDIITFNMDIGEYHIGTWLGNGKIAHAIPRYGVSVSSISSPIYGDNVHSTWRIL